MNTNVKHFAKDYFQDRLITVLNYVIEPKFERSAESPWKTNHEMEGSGGVSLDEKEKLKVRLMAGTEF